ncbi:hypothetical protein DSO57_1038912 [Entomophthora muscae]|uniref:Uncharacterized protein n=1 Tax=Entomophthora muscae TaxID=34485 RepID=A0ACC2TKY6_9FUNG|nr:hypothetical protein DSO57_1038912 [Entomophthora muscae]
MFVFCCLGNLTYILSIVFFAHDLAYLNRNLPWLMGATLPFIFDFTILGQSYIYCKTPPSPLYV